MSELWAKWEGQVIDGGLPLRRLVGVSDHSGVFLTEAPAHNLPNAALKLVPALPTLAESQLAYWNAAASLSHPRLLRLFAAGRCQLGSLHFLYVLMEYADQNLAQLLESRALAEVEVRETLPPLLDGLAFLHSRNLVQGQLKPSNILVVGEQLKLASDTIRPAGEAATSISMVSVYDPPEGRDGSFSTAGDVWALGVTLYEALTRTTPVRPDERSHGVVLPPDFPPASADVIRECLSRRPTDRPSVTALQAWISGKVRYPGAPSSVAAVAESGARAEAGVGAEGGARAESAAGAERAAGSGASGIATGALVGDGSQDGPANSAEAGLARARGFAEEAGSERDAYDRPAAGLTGAGGTAAGSAIGTRASPNQGRLTIRVEREPIHEEPPQRRSSVPVAAAFSAVLAVLIIAWGAVRLLGHHSSANPPSANAASSANTAQPTPRSADSQAPVAHDSQAPPPVGAMPAPPASTPSMAERSAPRHSAAASNATSQGSTATASGSSVVVHEELPNVPHSALATIHGHVKVAVRVTVDSSGNVVDDTLDHAGPSHYFARVASQAARKWKFTPDPKSDRQWLVHFDFSRTGTTAHATSPRS
jgi:TonB family protein